MIRFIALAAVAGLALAACAPPAADDQAGAPAGEITPVATEAQAGAYALDKNHGSLIVRIEHLGLSNYTVRFTDFDASMELDPANPAASSITATVNPRSVRAEYPGDYRAGHPGSRFATFDDDIALSDNWLSAAAFPDASFESTAVTLTGPDSADVAGNLTIRGVSAPMTFKAKFNGGFATHPFNPQGPGRIGVSARGEFNRSDFGMTFLQAGEGRVGVGDKVEIVIEAEFERQAAAADAP